MFKLSFKISLFFILMLIAIPYAYAGDVLYRLTHNDQYSLALGTVVSTGQDRFAMAVEKIISGKQVPSPLELTMPKTTKLQKGDHVIVSVDKELTGFRIKWAIIKVSSLDLATLEVLGGPFSPGERAAFQRYINSGGKDNDFFFDRGDAYLRKPDGTAVLIYPIPAQNESGETKNREEAASAEQEQQAAIPEWSYAVIIIVAMGVIAGLFYRRKKIT